MVSLHDVLDISACDVAALSSYIMVLDDIWFSVCLCGLEQLCMRSALSCW